MPPRSQAADVDTDTETATAAADAEYFQLHTSSPIPDECRTQSAIVFVNRKLYHFTRTIDDVLPVPEGEIVGKREAERLGVPVGRYETLTTELWREIQRGVIEIEIEYEAGRLDWDKYEATCVRYLRLEEAVGAIGGARKLPRDLNVAERQGRY